MYFIDNIIKYTNYSFFFYFSLYINISPTTGLCFKRICKWKLEKSKQNLEKNIKSAINSVKEPKKLSDNDKKNKIIYILVHLNLVSV